MKYLFIAGYSIIIILMGHKMFQGHPDEIDQAAYTKSILRKQLSTISCTPDWKNYHLSSLDIQQMIPLPGIGSYTWKISTQSDSAQFYFNQGINLYYGFHIIEALPSFKKAQTFDPACALLYWAEALSYGPNINDFGYAASPDALLATLKAEQLAGGSSQLEKGLIDAIRTRYSEDSTQKRAILNQHYAEAMRQLYVRFPENADVGALYADALMVEHPWDLWEHNGRPKPWTPQLQKVLESVLQRSPEHPGVNHYYIHTMEASPYAFKATASADRLGRLTPGMAHMVHMPSHIYIRTGQYEKGSQVNNSAVESYRNYLQLYPGVVNNAPLYSIHNRHMQVACSLNGDNYSTALRDAFECRNSIDTSFLSMEAPVGDYIQYVYMTPELTMITFKEWADILKQADVEMNFHYAALIQNFAKGMAYANSDDLKMAKTSLNKLESLLNEKDLQVILTPFNAPVTCARITQYILMGTIAEKENKLPDAIGHFKKAVETEDSLVYNEPRDWLIPARHFLAAALIRAKKYKEAEKVYREDLRIQPKNFIASNGLQEARR
ncbi:MAG: hypothetical protein ABI416_16025 [Ginsengibacter sp.]